MAGRFLGHSISDADLREGKFLFTEWRGKIAYAWDAGNVLSRFFQGLKEGRILGRRCRKCRRTLLPPRLFCERCFRRTDEWVALKDTGIVLSFSVSFVNWDASRREKPQVPAIIQLDGASEGIGLLHLLGRVGETLEEILERVKIGMRVKAVWKAPEEREGAITDILYFCPAGEGERS